jgi:hypothetical protein
MDENQAYELNDLLAAFMERNGISHDDDLLDDAVHAIAALLEGKD